MADIGLIGGPPGAAPSANDSAENGTLTLDLLEDLRTMVDAGDAADTGEGGEVELVAGGGEGVCDGVEADEEDVTLMRDCCEGEEG